MNHDHDTEAALLADWLADQDIAGRRVRVMPPALTPTIVGQASRHVEVLSEGPVDLLLAVGVPHRGTRPRWYSRSSVAPGGALVVVVTLGEHDVLGEVIAALRVPGLRCESFEELSEPSGDVEVRLLRLVQRRPADDAGVAP